MLISIIKSPRADKMMCFFTFYLLMRSRWDLQNLPDLFGTCKSFDFLFAKHDASCLKKGAQPVRVSVGAGSRAICIDLNIGIMCALLSVQHVFRSWCSLTNGLTFSVAYTSSSNHLFGS